MVEELGYPDPNRTLERYHATLGGGASLLSFIEEAKKQSKFNWRTEYTARSVNAYLRAGFLTGKLAPASPRNLREKSN